MRDLLMRLALIDLFRARWTDEILNECIRNVRANRPDLDDARLQRTRSLMNSSVRDCLVTGYETLIPGITLPDPDDCHVLAAAIRAGADAIVTYNLKDFPEAALKPYGIEAQHPDDFVLCQIDLRPALVIAALRAQRAALRNPPVDLDHFLAVLENQQLVQTVARLRRDHAAELV